MKKYIAIIAALLTFYIMLHGIRDIYFDIIFSAFSSDTEIKNFIKSSFFYNSASFLIIVVPSFAASFLFISIDKNATTLLISTIIILNILTYYFILHVIQPSDSFRVMDIISLVCALFSVKYAIKLSNKCA